MSEPAPSFEEIAHLADTLPHGDKIPLFEHLKLELEREQLAKSPSAAGWPPGFFERTYGSLADDPIERPPQGDFEERDEIE